MAIGLALAVVLIAGLMAWRGHAGAWQMWGLRPGMLKFLDAQVIAAGEVAWSEGKDPLKSNPADIAGRRLNYPRVWHGLYALGLTRDHGERLGWAMVGLGLAGVWLCWPTASVGGAVFVVLLVFSPAILLGAERGNIDLAVFFLLALTLAARRATTKGLLVGGAFAAKLFPLAGVAFVLARSQEEARRVAVALGAFALWYLCFTFDDLVWIRTGTPNDTVLSYGREVLPLRFEAWQAGAGAWVRVAFWAITLGVLAAAVWARNRGWRLAAVERAGEGWWIGVACFAGTFLLGTNFVYRLVFLVLLVPQLWNWAGGGAGAPLARAVLVAMLVGVWSFAWDPAVEGGQLAATIAFGVGQAALLVVFAGGLALAVAAWPDWAWPRRKAGSAEKAAAVEGTA